MTRKREKRPGSNTGMAKIKKSSNKRINGDQKTRGRALEFGTETAAVFGSRYSERWAGSILSNCVRTYKNRKELGMDVANNILKGALTLKPSQKAKLIDRLLSDLDKPDREIDELWAKEAENRIDAYDRGNIKSVPLEKVLEKYK